VSDSPCRTHIHTDNITVIIAFAPYKKTSHIIPDLTHSGEVEDITRQTFWH
jgi:hypothetical protein